ncbi:MAG: glycine--tRNA ligase subunit beta [Rhodobacteraceae bacterium]|nr:glycine--tRNA ligase subunit beta [Paracoccaceae bacterium]
MADLLLELFSEEIPARMQKRAAEDLKKLITGGMADAGVTYESAAAFVTPRRLVLSVIGVIEQTPALREERRGPKVGAPEKAIEGFLRGAGVLREDLSVMNTPKGDFHMAVIETPGRKSVDIIAEVIEATIRKFPWPKSMRWGTGSLRWVRPLHSILSIFGNKEEVEIVPVDIDGIVSGDSTEGHRFMGAGRFSVLSFEDYEAKLKANFVMLDPVERADKIWHDATNAAFAVGMEVVEDRALLNEVAGLVEWPVVLMGEIATDFLELPPEVLTASMREHQKFFSVCNPKTGRVEKFITVANRETADDGATILAGNQKVLFARLSDAKFFWENDLRVPLQDMAAKLGSVTFHNKLGTQAERVERIAALAAEIAPMVGASPELAAEAARLCKADLMSAMVGEFPELQGLMGRYYAQHAGMDGAVALACEQHYSPLGPSDDVPNEPVSVAVALADKIDTLTGFWAIDEKPTGSKDPFALRRAALGVIRLVLENGLRISLKDVFDRYALKTARYLADYYPARGEQREFDPVVSEMVGNANNLLAFVHDRLKVYLKGKGISHDVIDACLAMPNNDDLTLLVKRAEALQAFLNTDDGTNLLQGYKRAVNILKAEEKKDGVAYEGEPDVKFAEADVERDLFAALSSGGAALETAIKAEDFAAAMAALALLRAPIDAFFDGVQVNAESAIVRRNRLCLLNQIRETMHRVAKFGEIAG